MPPLTRTLGPTFSLPAAKPVTRAATVRRLLGQLMLNLPPHDQFFHRLSPDCETPLAFYLAGCGLGHEFTGRTQPDVSLATPWRNLHHATRSNITAPKRKFDVESYDDIARFQDLAIKQRSRDKNGYSVNRRLFETSSTRGQSTIITAVDEHASGNPGLGIGCALLLAIHMGRLASRWRSKQLAGLARHGDRLSVTWMDLSPHAARFSTRGSGLIRW